MIVGITGGTGFIGKVLVLRHLTEGNTVRLLSRYPRIDLGLPKIVKLFRGDLTGSLSDLINFVDGVDVLYHCAGEVRKLEKMREINVIGTKNLCIAADRKIGHFVQLSSVGVYGPHKESFITEDAPLNPITSYEKTKTLSDQLVAEFSKNGAFTYSILRPSNVFGPKMTNQSLFQMIDMISKRFFFFIGQPGASANYIHVDNVVEGLLLCGKMQGAKGQIYNLSDHRTMEEFVAIITNTLGKPFPKLRLPINLVRCIIKFCRKIPRFPLTESRIDGLTNRSIYSIEKIQNDLGYIHQMSMEDGIRQLVMAWKRFE